jgi:Flp pilus assembly protein TadG
MKTGWHFNRRPDEWTSNGSPLSVPRVARTIMKHPTSRTRSNRRGIIAVLAAVLFVVMLGMVAFAVDLGYIAMVKTQLQAAADSAALAAAGSSSQSAGMVQVAQAFAQYHKVAGRSVVLNTSDVEFGTWDTTTRQFTPVASGLGTAVRVTVKVDNSHGGGAGLFFGKIFGVTSATSQASAVAMVNPRDICFVVDLSSSMCNDSAVGSQYTALIQNVYDDIFGKTNNVSNVTYQSNESTTSITVPSGSQSWTDAMVVADMNKVLTNKPYMVPTPVVTSTDSKAYWKAFFEYSGSSVSYKKYVQFLTSKGRNEPVVNGNPPTYSIMSAKNPDYVKHTEQTDGGTFDNFPPREMPTHAVRRAIIAALKIIKDRNTLISETNQKDWVSIVAFDRANTTTDTDNVAILRSLTDNYTDAMQVAVKLQACKAGSGNDVYCTDSEGGLITARDHIKPASQGGAGRENANKVVVFLTDGQPNIYESDDSDINAYKAAHTGGWGSNKSQDASLMQAQTMQGSNWYLYAVGVGMGGSQSFMDLMAKKGGTAINGAAYPIANNVSTYESTLRGIFDKIVSNPKLRLVQ